MGRHGDGDGALTGGLSTDSLADPATVPPARSSSESPGTSNARWYGLARFAVAAVVAAAVSLAVWSAVPRSLSGDIDIIGFPTFTNFNYEPAFWAYRIVVVVFPVLLIACYATLVRYGPLRSREKPRSKTPIPLQEPGPSSSDADEPTAFRFGVIPRLALPVGVVVAAAAARSGAIDGFAVACGLIYVFVVVAVAGISSAIGSEPGRRIRPTIFWQRFALANGVGGSAAAFIGLWFVSRHTITMPAQGAARLWPWMPAWLAALAVAAALYWTLRQIRRGSPAQSIERTLLVVVVGSVALFLAFSALPAPVGAFEGFDDAQDMVGASLLNQGYFPWRDQLFIHGFFPDVLRGNLSIALFGDSIWGVFAGGTVLLTPLSWVILYLYAAWLSKGNAWFLAIVSAGALGGIFPSMDTRFILVPLVLILTGETLRRRSGTWCVALVLVLFAQAVLVPETAFLTIPVLACVAAADIVHRDPGIGVWTTMRRTRWCIATGTLACVVFGLFMAWHGALVPFVQYYLIFGPGHSASGAIPFAGHGILNYLLWAAGVVAVLATVWATASRIMRRAPWQPQDWVAVAAAGFVAFYEEKALGRFDPSHIRQVFGVALPLVLLWLWKALPAVNLAVTWSPATRRRPAAGSVTAGAVVVLIGVLAASASLLPAIRNVPANHRSSMPSESAYPRMGYAAPGALDVGLLRDLETALRAYAGEDAPVFDMTNSLGYVYYLLGRDPGTRFTHVSMAMPPYAQQLLIDELERSRPPVVIFDSTQMGLPSWDGIFNNVRHYLVSDYILDGWLPVMRTHGSLLMVRRDLVQRGLPLPSLAEQPVTTDLWFSGPACSWGTSPNFLRTIPQGPSVQVPVRWSGRRTVLDITGWAADPATGRPASSVVIVSGSKVVASVTPSLARPDVARERGQASYGSGFRFHGAIPEADGVAVYMLGEDGILHPLVGSARASAASVEFPDGRVLRTTESPAGHVDEYKTSTRAVGQINLPTGTRLTDFDLVSMSAGGGPVGNGELAVTDSIEQGSHYISARSLPGPNRDFAIRAGSCLQWRGFDATKPLYLLQDGGATVTTVTLSGVEG